MTLARVLEPVVSTMKNSTFKGRIIFVVQPLNELLQNSGGIFLAFDNVQSGPGDIVVINREGNSCRQMLAIDQAPVNAVICGIVDQVSVG